MNSYNPEAPKMVLGYSKFAIHGHNLMRTRSFTAGYGWKGVVLGAVPPYS